MDLCLISFMLSKSRVVCKFVVVIDRNWCITWFYEEIKSFIIYFIDTLNIFIVTSAVNLAYEPFQGYFAVIKTFISVDYKIASELSIEQNGLCLKFDKHGFRSPEYRKIGRINTTWWLRESRSRFSQSKLSFI